MAKKKRNFKGAVFFSIKNHLIGLVRKYLQLLEFLIENIFPVGVTLAMYGRTWQIEYNNPVSRCNLLDENVLRKVFQFAKLNPTSAIFLKENNKKDERLKPLQEIKAQI